MKIKSPTKTNLIASSTALIAMVVSLVIPLAGANAVSEVVNRELRLAVQPSATAVTGVAFAQQPKVQMYLANGHTSTTSGVEIQASLASGTGTLIGALTATTNSSGYAVFGNLGITGSGYYSISFSAPSLTKVSLATSNLIEVLSTLTAPHAAAQILGTQAVGSTLSADTTGSTGIPDPSFTFKWLSASTVDGTYGAISGATSSTYTPVEGDIGKFIKAEVTATNSQGSDVATSAPTAAIVATAVSPMITASATGAPAIGAELIAGFVLDSGTPLATIAFQWKSSATVDGTYENILGATSSKYTVLPADATRFILVTVAATNTAGTGTDDSNVIGPIGGVSPIASVIITGTQAKNSVLTADVSGSIGSPSPTFEYVWWRTGDPDVYAIVPGSDPTYLLTGADVGHKIKVQITETVLAETSSVISNPTDVIVDVAVPPTGSVAITGSAIIGEVLTAVTTIDTTTTNTPTIEYQWKRITTEAPSGVDITGATAMTYSPVDADLGLALVAMVSVTNDAGAFTDTATTSGVVLPHALSNDAKLSALTISSGTLSPAFVSSTKSYSASVTNAIASVSVTPTVNESHATIQVKVNAGSFASVVSGSTISGLALNVGSNTISVKVTAEDLSSDTYTVTVTRAAAGGGGGVFVPTVAEPTIPTISPTNPLIVEIFANQSKSVSANVLGPDGSLKLITIDIPAGVSGVDGSVRITPILDAAAFATGRISLEIQVLDRFGAVFPTLLAPIVLRFKSITGDYVVAKSEDGFIWTAIPQVTGPTLPEGVTSGYYIDASGNIVILSKGLSQFGLKIRQSAFSASSPFSSLDVLETVQLTTAGGSGLGSIAYTSTTPTVCLVSKTGLATGLKAGSCIINVTKGGDGSYLHQDASPVNLTVTEVVPAFRQSLKAIGSTLTKRITVSLGTAYKNHTVTMLIRTPSMSKYKFLRTVKLNSSGYASFKKAVPTGTGLRVTMAGNLIIVRKVIG
ncbi:unannotated protein [freshwater metagenome]|uniref:Unannotated protein n=1 Tax=freshwater metagenome TaxID=449393 RepID=A0A6J7XTC8_9ZZZZ